MQKKLSSLLALLLLSPLAPIGCPPSGKGDDSATSTPRTVVHVTDNITAPTSWTGDELYVIDNTIYVSAELTIGADTIIKITEGASINIEKGGTILTSDATAEAPCVFTSIKDDSFDGDTNEDSADSSPAPGDWGGISVAGDGSVFHQCEIYYAGANMPYTGAFVVLGNASVSVTDCTFGHNQGGEPADTRAAALHAGNAGIRSVITGNLFFDNDLPLVINGNYDLDDSNSFQAEIDGDTVTNTYNGIFWGGGYETAGDIHWLSTQVPYVITSAVLGVTKGSTLTLGDGVIIKFDAGFRIDVAGTLIADGESGISFTSLLDDSMGGDTNGDGATTAAAPGDWAGVFVSADGSVFDHCLFQYGGNAAPYSGTLMMANGFSATITNNTFTRNAGGMPEDTRAAALNLANATAATVVTGNIFYGNEIPLTVNALVSIDGSNVFHFLETGESEPTTNTWNGIFMDGASHEVSGNLSWSNTEVAYVLENVVLSIAKGATLTLGDDVVVKSNAGRIDVMGAIEQGENTWFTSMMDDSLVGDTNGDASATSPAKGDWSGVNLCLGGPCEWADWGNILYATNP